MHKLLAVVVLALLYMATVGALECTYCRNVGPDNVCKHKEKTCQAGNKKFCYIRLTVKEGRIQRMERGCSRVCHTIKYRNSRRKREKYMLCCDEDHCNGVKLWKQ